MQRKELKIRTSICKGQSKPHQPLGKAKPSNHLHILLQSCPPAFSLDATSVSHWAGGIISLAGYTSGWCRNKYVILLTLSDFCE